MLALRTVCGSVFRSPRRFSLKSRCFSHKSVTSMDIFTLNIPIALTIIPSVLCCVYEPLFSMTIVAELSAIATSGCL